VTKNSNSLPSKTLCSQSSTSSNERIVRQQSTVCYRSNNSSRPITRRRAATVVHCSYNTPVSKMTNLTNKSPIHQSISKEKQCFSSEKLSPIIDISPRSVTKDESKINITLTEPRIIIKTDCDEIPLSASIIETC
jgi:hypothetical protein